MPNHIVIAKNAAQFELIKRWLYTENLADTTDKITLVHAYAYNQNKLIGICNATIWLAQGWTDGLDSMATYEFEQAIKARAHSCTIKQAKY